MTDASHAPVSEGDVLAKKYRVENVLGVGGMGVVVSAVHLQLEQRVALKFLLPSLLDKPQVVQRFEREARAAARIKSEHVARVIDVGELESGSPYMVMEFLEGEDLAAVLTKRGPLPVADVVNFVIQACDAIAEAHSVGIVHRDLKPANLFLAHRPDKTRLVKVLDFGISKMAGAGSEAQLTQTQGLLGSPVYMSPEQMTAPKTVDSRSDVWALGVIMFELLSGATPFVGETMPELVVGILHGTAPSVASIRPDVPAPVADAIARCLEKDRDARYRSVGDLAVALAPYVTPEWDYLLRRIPRVLGENFVPVAAAQVPLAPASTPEVSPAISSSTLVIPRPPAPHSDLSSTGTSAPSGWGATSDANEPIALPARSFPTLAALVIGGLLIASGVGIWTWQGRSTAPASGPAPSVQRDATPLVPSAVGDPAPLVFLPLSEPTVDADAPPAIAQRPGIAAATAAVARTPSKSRPIVVTATSSSALPPPAPSPSTSPAAEPKNKMKMEWK
jgi:serine/threonine-protein kinase